MGASPLRLATTVVLVLACLGGTAAAQETQEPPQPDTVHINAIKNPERWTYRAIVAGQDMFEAQHALAPNVPQLLFKVDARGGKAWSGDAPLARIAADDFSIPLVLDDERRFAVPRNAAAYDAKAELVLNRKKRDAMVMPWIRTPGLPDNQYRLGDVRLRCKVTVAIVKEEAPFWAVGLVNSVLLTGDWCGWFKGPTPKGGDRSWPQETDARLAAATLRDGGRSMALKVKGRTFSAPVADAAWSDDAVIELEYAPPEPDQAAAAPVSTSTSAPASE